MAILDERDEFRKWDGVVILIILETMNDERRKFA
jgi:hypothetical protein